MSKRYTAVIITLMFALTLILPVKLQAQNSVHALKIGDYVRFGSYNSEPILWKVINLDESGDPMLLSDKVISYKFFDAQEATKENNKGYSNFSLGNDLWVESTIRQWLNSDTQSIKWKNYAPICNEIGASKYLSRYDKEKGFLADGNFTDKDRKAIKPVVLKTVITSADRDIRDGGSEPHLFKGDIANSVQNYDKAYYINTTDKVFLLSVKELHDYVYARDWDYRAKPTSSAVRIAGKDDQYRNINKYTNYMLRCASTEHLYGGNIRYVDISGTVGTTLTIAPLTGIRPAVYLSSFSITIKSGKATEEDPYIVEGNGLVASTPAPTSNTGGVLKDGNFFYKVLNNNAEITGYSSSGSKAVVIPEKLGGYPITSIGDEAFISRNITSVTFPKSLKNIGKSAFYDNSLTNLTINSSITSIGEGAFSKNKLTSVKIEANLKDISNSAFSYNAIKSITLPASLVNIGDDAFYSNNLTTIKLPNKILNIGKRSFQLNKLTSIEIPDSVIDIGENSFSSNNLITATIGNGVKNIGFSAFSVNKLKTIKLGTSVKTISEYAFCHNQLTNIVLPDSVVEIKQDGFSENQLTSIKLNKNLKTIGYNAFYMNRITSIVIPDGVTSIGQNAFASNFITKLTLPNSVKTIGMSAFADNRLTSISLPSSITTIEPVTFNQNQLTSVVIPDSVTRIGGSAFSNNKLTSITIGNKVNTIEECAFLNNKVTSVTMPASVTSLGSDVFYKKESKPSNFKINGVNGSEAQRYAKEYGYAFIPSK